jgi:hypothetical protein
MTRSLFGAVLAISVASIAGVLPTSSRADARCQQIEALHDQYAGVELTSEQKQLKRKLVAWYYGHCRGRHVAAAD